MIVLAFLGCMLLGFLIGYALGQATVLHRRAGTLDFSRPAARGELDMSWSDPRHGFPLDGDR